MAKAKAKNADLLNAVAEQGSLELQDKVGTPTTLTEARESVERILQYPTVRDEFYGLIGKIATQVVYGKAFQNPLKEFKKEKLEYGIGIEQIMLDYIEGKDFNQHYEGSDSVEGDLIKAVKPKVNARYIAKNYAYKYKITINDNMVKQSFLNEYGFKSFIDSLIEKLQSSVELKEFKDMKKILINAIESGKDFSGKTFEKQDGQQELQAPFAKTGDYVNNIKLLAEDVRAMSGNLKFPSTKYNMCGVTNHTDKKDLVFFSTPEIIAKLDVEVLATAFNVSATELTTRVVELDELPTKVCTSIGQDGQEKKVFGILVDKEFLQVRDTIYQTESFRNADKMITNIFSHKQGVMAECLFANMVVFVQE